MFFSQLRHLYRGRWYFILALVLFIAGKFVQPPFAGVSPRAPWQDLVDEVIEQLPLLALVLLIAGVSIAVLLEVVEFLWTDKVNRTVSDGFDKIAQTVATGVTTTSGDVVVRWIKGHTASDAELKSIAMHALREAYGDHAKAENSYLDYVVDNLVDPFATEFGVARLDLVSDITVTKQKLTIAGAEHDVFGWEETKHYTLFCPAGDGVQPILARASSRIDAGRIRAGLDNLQLEITIDGRRIFDVRDILKEENVKTLIGSGRAMGDKWAMEFDGTWLSLEYKSEVQLTKKRTGVRVFERNHVTCDDRYYQLSMRQPTRNFTMTFQLGAGMEGWRIKRPTVGPERYHVDARRNVEIDQPHPRRAVIHVPQWILPGIACSVEWGPESDARVH